jgi:hypothetical protein
MDKGLIVACLGREFELSCRTLDFRHSCFSDDLSVGALAEINCIEIDNKFF